MIRIDNSLHLEPGLEYSPMSDRYYRHEIIQGRDWTGVSVCTFEEVEDYLKEHHYKHWCSRKLGLDY